MVCCRAAGGTQTIPRMVGRSKALEAFLSNERMDAAGALETGPGAPGGGEGRVA